MMTIQGHHKFIVEWDFSSDYKWHIGGKYRESFDNETKQS